MNSLNKKIEYRTWEDSRDSRGLSLLLSPFILRKITMKNKHNNAIKQMKVLDTQGNNIMRTDLLENF